MTPRLLSAESVECLLSQITEVLGGAAGQAMRAHIAALEAANAALLDQLNATANALDDLDLSDEEETRATLHGQAHVLDAISKEPHPGAQLLAEVTRLREHARLATEHAVSCTTSRLAEQAEHAEALVRARNEGLGLASVEVQRSRAKAVPPSEAHALLTYALDSIDAMKETES